MKPEKPKERKTIESGAAPVLWRPTWRWHLKTLAVIYLSVTALYFVVDHFLSRLPEPYKLRDIPKEMTPWLKK